MAQSKGCIAVYVRVSSSSQDYKSQKPDLRKWLKDNAGNQTIKWYEDVATGRNMDRPAFNQMTQDIESGQLNIKTILIWRLNRLGRTTSGLVTFFDYLCTKAINLVSLKDSFDLRTSQGKMIAGVLASIAEYDNEVRKEAQFAGIQAARESPEGITWGGSKKGRIIIEKDKIKAIRQLHRSGTKIAEIARVLEISRPTIYKFIANQK